MDATAQSKSIKKANRLLKKGKTSQAIEVLESEILKDPKNGELQLRLGVLYQNIGQYNKAEQVYRSAESLSPESPDIKWQLGEFLLGVHRVEEAIPYLRYSANNWPSNAQTHALLGRALLQLKRYKEAETSLNKALQLDDYNPDARDAIVDLYNDTEREDLVRGVLTNYLENAPKLASSHVSMAEFLHYEEGDYLGSLPYYEKGLLLAENKRMGSWYLRFFSTNGYPQSIAYNYLIALQECGYVDLARKIAREYLEGTTALMWNAQLEIESGDVGAAIRLMKEAVEVEPYQPAWKIMLGWYYLLGRKLQRAEIELREALQLPVRDPTDVEGLAALYIVLVEQEKIEQVERMRKDAFEKDGAYFWLSLAAHYAELENWEKTLEASQYALEAKPNLKFVHLYKARALVKLEDLPGGIQAYQELIKLQPRNGKAYLELGEAYAKAGEEEKAISILDKALSDSILSEPQKDFANQIRANLSQAGV